ncbi:MAG: cupin domain-containing protein [Acetatifactor sp.]
MSILKNLPIQEAKPIKELVDIRKGQVLSMALSNSEHAQMTILSFAENEMVSEESYFGDTMYLLLEGEAEITMENRKVSLREGEVCMVPSYTLHAIGGGQGFKILQITMNEE